MHHAVLVSKTTNHPSLYAHCITEGSQRELWENGQWWLPLPDAREKGRREWRLGPWHYLFSLWGWGVGGEKSQKISPCAHIGIILDFLRLHRKFRGSFRHCPFPRPEEISALGWWKNTIWSLGKSSGQNKGLIRALQNYDEILRK
jgi:hypothetical protein